MGFRVDLRDHCEGHGVVPEGWGHGGGPRPQQQVGHLWRDLSTAAGWDSCAGAGKACLAPQPGASRPAGLRYAGLAAGRHLDGRKRLQGGIGGKPKQR